MSTNLIPNEYTMNGASKHLKLTLPALPVPVVVSRPPMAVHDGFESVECDIHPKVERTLSNS